MATNFRFNNGGTITDFSDVFIRRDLFSKGGLWLWGYNAYGDIGDNTTVNKSSPVQTVAGGSGWKSVSRGNSATAAIKTDGTLWTWGYNGYGQLGDNTRTWQSSPIQTIASGNNWKEVGCSYHVAAIKADGTLWTWGYNNVGQLGDNTAGGGSSSVNSKSSPVQTVAGGTNWKQVSVNGDCVGAIKTDGTLWMWGYNANGRLGDNTTTDTSSPVQTVAGGTNWKQVSVGSRHTGAVKTDGTLWTWGYNGFYGLGNGTSTTSPNPSPIQTVVGGTTWKQVSAGSDSTAAIKTDGTLWVWGSNAYGELCINSQSTVFTPRQTVTGGTNWKQVNMGGSRFSAIKTDGTLWMCGFDGGIPMGSMGDGTTEAKSSPVQTLAGGTNWKTLSIGQTGAAITDIFGDGSGSTDGGPTAYLPSPLSLLSTYGNPSGADAQAWTELIFKTDGRMTTEEANSGALGVQVTVNGSWLSSSPGLVSTAIAGKYDIELTPDSHTLSIDGVRTFNELSGTSRSTNSTGTSWNTRLQLGTTNLSRFLVSEVTSGDGSSYVESAYINFTATIYYRATNVVVASSQVSFSTEASTGPPI